MRQLGFRSTRVETVRRVTCETLESRRLFATTTLRVVSYNLDADTDGNTTTGPGLATVLQGIGAYAINGSARPIDVLSLQETTSNAATVQPVVDALNAVYGAGTYAASPLQLTESNNDPTFGNGPNALVYNTKTVTLLESYAVPGALNATTGVNRQIGRYELRPKGATAAGDFYVYVNHYKSGVGASNADRRAKEAAVVRQDEATLPATARVIYTGDFNTSTEGEGIFTTLMAAGQGQAFDPLDPTAPIGHVEEGLASLSESANALRYRDDYQMVTGNVLNDSAGLRIVPGSFRVFGNNGTVPMGGSINSASNTALASLPNGADVLQALTTTTDHLPVVADYTDVIPSPTGSVAGTVTNGPAGETLYLDANNNAKRDTGEPATTTGTGGAYAFASVTPGTYIVRQVLTGGYTQTTPTMNYGIHLTVAAGSVLTGNNFTDKAPAASGATIGGTVTGGPVGETVYLDANNNSKLDTSERRTSTSSAGVYRFDAVPAGAYIVRQVVQSGYKQTSPANGFGIHVSVANGTVLSNQNFTDSKFVTTNAAGTAVARRTLFSDDRILDAWSDLDA